MENGNTLTAAIKKEQELKPVFNASLDKFQGEWSSHLSAHLLRRTLFGVDKATIESITSMGLDAALDQLLADVDLPEPPVYYDFENDPDTGLGETWVESKYYQIAGLPAARNRSLYGWTIGGMLSKEISIVEKMVLFWHNHFVIENINDARFVYRYSNTLRSKALGNFKQLVKDITIDPSMLRYLNGRDNSAAAPNENYARELLELFTIGKGELAGPGDYTTFTEDDVVEMARVLTGWRDYGFNNPNANTFGSEYINGRHDQNSKQLSHRFGNVVIQNAGDTEYSNLVDIIFEQDEVSRFICRKLYRWFVHYEITSEIEANIIEPMSQILRDNDYNIKPALRALLSSEHFYDLNLIGCMIKSPIDYLMTIFNQYNLEISENLFNKYRLWIGAYEFTSLMQMRYYFPPSVAGWKAYYQEPAYYQTWINSVTLPLRFSIVDLLVVNGVQLQDNYLIADVLAFVASLNNPLDVNDMLQEISDILYPNPLTEVQYSALKEILIPGLPDFEWTVEYSEYLADPDNDDLRNSVQQKLRILLQSMMRMPEYSLS